MPLSLNAKNRAPRAVTPKHTGPHLAAGAGWHKGNATLRKPYGAIVMVNGERAE